MRIHLISYTHEPLKSIAAGILNIGIGKDITNLEEITREEAEAAFNDTISSWLTSPLEFANFNFFWQDIPLFMRTELERARIGWSYAERSMRFFQADERDPADKIDWDLFPSVWRKAAGQIKELVTSVDSVLGASLVDVCEINHRCVWHSRLDRPCDNCQERGKSEENHQHNFTLTTKSGAMQCSCGVL